MNYIVATDAGGGYDTNGRLVAEFMQKHLPGSTFVVQNMPGAGHLIGTNFVYASAPDGLTIGTFNTGLIYSQLAGKEGIKFDLAKMSWIGKVSSDPRVFVVSKESGIENWEQLKALKEPIKFAAAGVGSASTIESTMMINTLKLPIQVVTGYNGNDDQLAMRRGEVQGILGSRSTFQQFVDEGHGKFIAQIGGSETDVPQLATLETGGRGAEGDRAGRLAEQHLASDRWSGWYSGRRSEDAARRLSGCDVGSGVPRKGKGARLAGRPAGRRCRRPGRRQGDGPDAGDGRVPQGGDRKRRTERRLH